jgi:predicted Zn-dependent protease
MRALAPAIALGLLLLAISCMPNYGKPYRLAPVWTDARLIVLAQSMTEQNYTIKDDNPVLVEEVGKIYRKMCLSISWEPPNPNFTVIKEAYLRLLPDGRLEIGEPFLAPLRDEAMVAALLAHMIAHVVYGHLNSILEYKYPHEIFTLRGESDPSVWQEQSAKLEQALKNGYPADWEREATEGAIAMMISAGYDPAAAAEAWEILSHNANKAVRDFATMHHLHSEEAKRFWEQRRYDVAEPVGGWMREREVWQDALSGIKTLLKPINP